MQTTTALSKQITSVYERNVDTVYRVCVLFFRGKTADAEDAVQSTFMRLITEERHFDSPEHEKAWLIVTASNICRDMLSSPWRKRVDMDERAALNAAAPFKSDELMELVMALPDRYKAAVYLFYYEGYSAGEIAGWMGKSQASVWGYLHMGRKLLKNALKEESTHEA